MIAGDEAGRIWDADCARDIVCTDCTVEEDSLRAGWAEEAF